MTPAASQVKKSYILHALVVMPLWIEIIPGFRPGAPCQKITIFRAGFLATSDQGFAAFSPQPPPASMHGLCGLAQQTRRTVAAWETKFTKP
jgi:hypothetical protein